MTSTVQDKSPAKARLLVFLVLLVNAALVSWCIYLHKKTFVPWFWMAICCTPALPAFPFVRKKAGTLKKTTVVAGLVLTQFLLSPVIVFAFLSTNFYLRSHNTRELKLPLEETGVFYRKGRAIGYCDIRFHGRTKRIRLSQNRAYAGDSVRLLTSSGFLGFDVIESRKLIRSSARQDEQKQYQRLIIAADRYFSAGNFTGAKKLFSRAVNLKPSDGHAKQRLAETDSMISTRLSRFTH